MKVLKFGGSSLATPDRIRRVAEIVRRSRSQGPVAVVVSAFGGVTDRLEAVTRQAARREEGWRAILAALGRRHLEAAAELARAGSRGRLDGWIQARVDDLGDLLHGVFLLREASPRTLDGVLSYGERLSASVVAAALEAAGLEAEALDARELIVTDDGFGAARVDSEPTFARIAHALEAACEGRGPTPVLPGFVGASPEGHTTTLGRGGSDLTAALVGVATGAEAVELWTDVAGVMSADPRRVPDAFPLPRLSYAELMELSHFGAKVVYPPTVHPARARGIPLVIKSTLDPEAPGTHVGAKAPESPYPVRAISSIHRVAMMRLEGDGMVGVPGIAQRLFGALAREGVSVILISQASSEHSICFAVAPGDADRTRRSADSEFRLERRAGLIEELTVEEDVAILAAIGEGMRERHGLAGRLFGVLGDHGVNVRAIAQGSSERNVSIAVAAGDETRALRAVHGAFFHPRRRRIELAVAGTGRVARAFLAEVAETAPEIARSEEVDLRLVALWNTRRMALVGSEGEEEEEGEGDGDREPEPLDPTAWEAALDDAGAPDLEAVARRLGRRHGATRVLVDLTATDALVPLWCRLLETGAALVAANKVPFAGPYERYRELVEAAGRGGSVLRIGATVGAGLPVLSTLDDLVRTGDRVESVEGLLSGTLNFVLDRLGAGERFSRAVRQAYQKGLTEPHPAEDLSGGDVVRKLVILARRAGPGLHPRLEPEEVSTTPLLPADRGWTELALDDFFREIEAFDDGWARRQEQAMVEGKRLRHLASLDRAGARVEVTAVGPEHPCFEVAAADNLVAFTTARYRTTPLVIRGPGAGPEVTAAGVFADVLRAAGGW